MLDVIPASPLQYLSIASSTITIVISIVNWVAKNRRAHWIHAESPSAASLLPISFLVLTNIFSGTVSFRLFFFQDGPEDNVYIIIKLFALLFIHPVSTIFTLLIIVMPCRSACCVSRCWKISRTVIHFCLSSVVPVNSFYLLATATDDAKISRRNLSYHINYYMFCFIIVCQITHFLLGTIMFSGLNVAKIFTPPIIALVSFARSIVNRCRCCPEEWRNAICEMLHNMLKVESENRVVGTLEEGENVQMIESHDVVIVEMESRMVGTLEEGEDDPMIEAHEEVKVESVNRMAGTLEGGEVA